MPDGCRCSRLLGAVAVAAMVIATVSGCSDDADTEQNDVDANHAGDAGGDVDASTDADANDDRPDPDCPLEFEDRGAARVFTFGSKIGVEHAESYETYEAYFRGQAEEVQECFSDDRPNILLYPEDAGLHAGLIGSRGAEARNAPNAEAAFTNLLLAYGDTIGAVDERFDDLELPRRIFLGLTDTLWRAMDSTFSSIADDFDVWVLTSGNVAYIEETSDEEAVDTWADPDLEDVDSVYVPVDERVYNSALIYNPDGELVDRVNKPFLTATEEEELALSYGTLQRLRPVQLGPFSAGVFTSKDAWMPPMNDRLGLLGADFQVQPEAFSGWGITHLDDQNEWLPDVITQSGWAAVQKYPSFRYGAMPVLTGNFVGMVFDGQAVIWGQAHPGVEWGGFVGQHERPGFLEVGPWAFDDPVEDDPDMPLNDRRDELRELGEAMLPGAGEPHENAYLDSVVARDLAGELDYDVDGDLQRSEQVDVVDVGGAMTSEGPAQRLRLDADGDRLAVGWQDEFDDQQRARWALLEWDADQRQYESADGDSATSGGGEYLAPSVALNASGGMLRVYQRANIEMTDGSTREDSELSSTVQSQPDASPSAADIPQLDDSRDVWLPALDADGDRIALVYTDRATGHDRVYLSISDDGGETFGQPEPVDDPPEVDPPNTRGIQWHPDVAIDGDTIAVVWTDFRDFQWDLYGTFSLDGGDNWTAPRRLDDAGDGFERLHTDPRVVLDGNDRAIVSWTYQADRRPDTDARYIDWDLAEDELGDSVVLDSDAETYPTQGWLPVVEPVGDGVAAAWLEMTEETSRVALKLPGRDDPLVVSHPGRVAAWPELTVVDDRVVVVFAEHDPDDGYRPLVGVVELE